MNQSIEKKNIFESFKKIFSKHYAIERFGVIFVILTSLMILVLVSTFNTYVEKNRYTMSSQAIYTTNVEMSLSGAKGIVHNIYTNTDNTKAFVLLKFDDMSVLPTNANNYQVWLTGVDANTKKVGMSVKPTASIYVMGSTGYIGIYLTDHRGFDSQILYLVLRNNAQLTAVNSEKIVHDTFTQFDQCTVYFNPGAQDAIVTDLLDSDRVSASALYEEFVARSEETLIRRSLSDLLVSMRTEFNRIDNFSAELESLNVLLPDNLAETIKGDTLTAIRNSENESVLDEFGNDLLFLNTEYVFPKGYHFNWQDGSVKTGYLKELTGSTSYEEYGQWLDELSKQSDSSKSLNVGNLVWYKVSSNGSSQEFKVADFAKAVGINGEIFVAATNLQNAWLQYESLKKTYQTSILPQLVMLEYTVIGIDLITTVNNSENVITNW